jgi:hypothetical protein
LALSVIKLSPTLSASKTSPGSISKKKIIWIRQYEKYHLEMSVWKTSPGSVTVKSTPCLRGKKSLNFLPLEYVPTGCHETSVSNIAEERRSQICSW